MADNDVKIIQQAFDEVKAGLSYLRMALQQLTKSIDSNQYIPANAITVLSSALEQYRVQAEKLESVGAELSIPIGNDITDISNAIHAFEDKCNNSLLRKLVLDYFKLTAEQALVNGWLEESKRKLMEKCASISDKTVDTLTPYMLAVDYVRSNKQQDLSVEQLQILEGELGPHVATSVYTRSVQYDDNHDVSPYLDGSCEILLLEDTPSNSKVNGEPEIVPVETEHTEIVDSIGSTTEATDSTDSIYTESDKAITTDELIEVEKEEKRPENTVGSAETETKFSAKKYSGLVSEATFEYADNRPASELRASEFKSAVQQKHDIPYILKWLAEEKFYTLGQVGDSQKNYICPAYAGTMEYLVKHGYITKITVHSCIVSGEYYTLSDKGWACYTKHDVAQFLKNEYNKNEKVNHAKLPVPKSVQMSSKDMDSLKAVTIALLHEYSVRKQSHSIIFSLPSYTFAISLAEKQVGVFSAVFNAEEDVESAIKGISDFIKNTGDGRQFVIIVADKSDMDTVRAIFAERDELWETLTYCVLNEDYQIFDTNGNIA